MEGLGWRDSDEGTRMKGLRWRDSDGGTRMKILGWMDGGTRMEVLGWRDSDKGNLERESLRLSAGREKRAHRRRPPRPDSRILGGGD